MKTDEHCKHFPLQRRVDAVINRIEMIIWVWVQMSNPNGDPRNEGNPRTTPLGHGYISADSFKRWLRNALETYFGGHLLIPQSGSIGDVVEKLIADSGKKAKDFAGASGEAVLAKLVTDYFIDARLFGGLITKPISIGLRGPVKIHLAESVDQVRLVFHKGVRKSHASSKGSKGETEVEDQETSDANDADQKHGVFTSRVMVHAGLYPFTVEVDGEQARKNGLTYGDLDDLITASLSMYSWFGSSVRSNVAVRRIDIWQHSHPRGTVTAGLMPRMTKAKAAGTEPVQAFEDYSIETPQTPQGVTHTVVRPEDALGVVEAEAAE